MNQGYVNFMLLKGYTYVNVSGNLKLTKNGSKYLHDWINGKNSMKLKWKIFVLEFYAEIRTLLIQVSYSNKVSNIYLLFYKELERR